MSETEIGAVPLDQIKVIMPTGREKYNWKAIKKAITNGKAYRLPLDAKKNSVISGLKNNEINAKVGTIEGTEQLVVVPT